MTDYEPQEWSTGDKFQAADATAMSTELEEQEVHDLSQDEQLAGVAADVAAVQSVIEASASMRNLMSKLVAGVSNATIVMNSDSTGATSDSWLLATAQWLAVQFPAYTVNYYLWDEAGNQWPASPTWTDAGTGAYVLNVWNAGVGGSTTGYFQGSRFPNLIKAADLVIVNHGFNQGGPLDQDTLRQYRRNMYYAFVYEFAAANPNAGVLLIGQPPTAVAGREEWQAQKNLEFAKIAAWHGWGFLNVHRAWIEHGNWQADLTLGDQVHPTAAGLALWASLLQEAMKNAARVPVATQPALGVASAQVFRNPQLSVWGSTLPDGVTSAVNCTVTKELTDFETGAWAMKLTATGTGFAYVELTGTAEQWGIKGRLANQTYSAAVRLKVPAANTGTVRVALLDNNGNTYTMATDVATWPAARDRYIWVYATKAFPSNATTLTMWIVARTSGSAAAEVLVDEIRVTPGPSIQPSISGWDGGVPQSRVTAWSNADAYIDFTNKPDGDPPPVLDTGQPVDYVLQLVGGRKPQVSSGKLVAYNVGTGSYADYYQAQCEGDVLAAGTEWTSNTADGSTQGVMCIAVWAYPIEGAGTLIPKMPAHITVDTLTGAVSWWVSDGLDNSHLKAVKSWTITPPAQDGAAIWEVAFRVDPELGVGWLFLPGPTADGERIVRITDAEIAASLTAQSVPVATLAQLSAGADVVMIEHQCNVTANTARMPRFLNMWGNVRRRSRNRDRELLDAAVSSLPVTVAHFAPTTQRAQVVTTSNVTLYIDAANTIEAAVTATAGPTGKIDFLIPALCVEFAGTTGALDRAVTDSAITSGLAVLTSATAAFTAADAGRQVSIVGAGVSGATLTTTILTYTNATTVALALPANTTVSGAPARISASEAMIFARVRSSDTAALVTTSEVIVRGRSGERWTGAVALRAEGLVPYSTRVWALQLSRFTFGDATATVRLGGANTSLYPSLKIIATPR